MQDRATQSEERIILGHILHRKNPANDQLGFVKPLAELSNGRLQHIDPNDFCDTQKIFITTQYDALEKQYPDGKFFQLKIRLSNLQSENVNPLHACKYIASGTEATSIPKKDFFEVLSLALPPAGPQRIVVPNELPCTDYVFINDSVSAYGPFKWSHAPEQGATAIEIHFIDAPLPNVHLAKYQIYKISSAKIDSISVADLDNKRQFLQGLSVLQGATYFDYASEDEILLYCVKIAGDQGFRILGKQQIESLLLFVRRNPKLDGELVRNRLERLVEITDVSRTVQENITKSMSSFLNSEIGQSIVKNFIEQKESDFIEKIKKEKEQGIEQDLIQKNNELKAAAERLKELNERKIILNNEINSSSLKKESELDLSLAYQEKDEKLREKSIELQQIQEEINNTLEKHKLVMNLDKIKRDLDYYERRIQDEKKKADEAEEMTQRIIAMLQEKDRDLQKKMMDLKPFVDALNGSFSSSSAQHENIAVTIRPLSANGISERQMDVVNAVKVGLASNGRYLEEHEVANLLITIQQSFLTVFAGLPGTGKTSLARLLAHAQDSRPRLREVAVSRGWTSQKDLIGYYNPLTSRFQASSTGVYGFLKALDSEKNHAEQAMAYILLDEANLSPIEHYWSAFMGQTDHEGSKSLILGNETIEIPECLRFIATINYDGTTEPLSPRLINRAPVIVLESSDDSLSTVMPLPSSESILPIAAKQMKELFGLSSHLPEFDQYEKPAYEKIREKLALNDQKLGRPIAISPRKETAIRQYCAKARLFMNKDSDTLALDFAVLQHILPLIQGTGENFASRLKELKDVLDEYGLTKSARGLERIISFGESDLQTYDFFCW